MYSKDLTLPRRWQQLLEKLENVISKKPSGLDAVLFLIGVQELGKGNQLFTKEEKQDIMHIAVCKLLSMVGYYQLEGTDEDGWPHWELISPLPRLSLPEQEKLLKGLAIDYFIEEYGWVFD